MTEHQHQAERAQISADIDAAALQKAEEYIEQEEGAHNKLKGWLETGEYRIDPDLDPIQVAANAVTASAIINSDAALTKR